MAFAGLAMGAPAAAHAQARGRKGERAKKAAGTAADELAEVGPARTVGIAELFEVAARQSPALARARIDLAKSEGEALSARAVDDWVLTATGEYRLTKNPPISGQPVQTTRTEILRMVTGLAVPVSTGGRIAIDFDLSQDNSDFLFTPDNNSFPQSFGSRQYIAVPSLRLNHPLLRGAGPNVGRAERDRAAFALTAAEHRERAAAIQAIFQIVEGYWSLAHARAILEVRKQGVALAMEQLRIARVSIDSGRSPESVARAVGHRLAVREQEFLAAEVDATEKALALRRLVGLELGPGEIALAPKEPLAELEKTFAVEETLTRVLAQNPQLAAYEILVKSAGVGSKAARDQRLPSLEFAGRVGPRGVGESLGNAINQVGTFDNVDVQASLNLSYEFPMRAGRGATQQAEADERKSKLDREEFRRELVVETVRGIDRVRSTSKQVEVGKRAVELAEANLADEQARFRAGRTTIFEVLDRQEDLQKSRATLLDSLLAQQVAVARVESLTGEILERYGIVVDTE